VLPPYSSTPGIATAGPGLSGNTVADLIEEGVRDELVDFQADFRWEVVEGLAVGMRAVAAERFGRWRNGLGSLSVFFAVLYLMLPIRIIWIIMSTAVTVYARSTRDVPRTACIMRPEAFGTAVEFCALIARAATGQSMIELSPGMESQTLSSRCCLSSLGLTYGKVMTLTRRSE